ncbi:MAG: GWxTD domain-containing protein [Acidobacteria bacterium]|nr:GWxTD domain-containing protein [Acidobacteriota bacterium]
MQVRNFILSVGLATMLAGSAGAAISKEIADQGKGPMSVYMTRDEQKAWKALKTDDEAKAFIQLFWARRDPTPNTPQNEFVDEVKLRVTYADQTYATGRSAGWASDKGKIHLLFGPPSRREGSGGPSMPNIQTPGGTSSAAMSEQVETWIYEKDRVPQWVGMPEFRVAFRNANNSGDWKLGHEIGTDVNGLMQKAVTEFIVSPALTAAPDWGAISQQQAAAAAETARLAAMQAPPLKAELAAEPNKAALASFKGATTSPYKTASVTTGEFVTVEGHAFVAAQLYLSGGMGLAADQVVTFFGVVEDSTGKVIGAFEEEAKLHANRHGDLYVDRSLPLTAGKYVCYLGVQAGGKVVALAKGDATVAGLTKDAASVSDLMLASAIYPMTEAQRPADPFAFGGLKIVPEGDGTFFSDDELWFLVELRNPGVDPTTNLPKIQLGAEVEGNVGGKPKKLKMPLAPMDAQQIKDTPGHFILGTSITLEKLPAADYKIKVKVIDSVLNKTYEKEGKFSLAVAPAAPAPAPSK